VTLDVHQARQRFMIMMAANTVVMLIAVGFAIGHFVYGVDWMLWAFLGFLALGFGVQLWFVRGIARAGKGE
jgi:hypothetical protein